MWYFFMKTKYKQGWYKLVNPEKYISPLDEHMQSSKFGHVLYKSSLELKAIRYADFNKHITKWGLEPFGIPYVKPTDGKVHRYFIDLFIILKDIKILIEIKPKSQTIKPKLPSIKTPKSIRNYQYALQTYYINLAKWQSAREFCKKRNMKFIILTEEDLR